MVVSFTLAATTQIYALSTFEFTNMRTSIFELRNILLYTPYFNAKNKNYDNKLIYLTQVSYFYDPNPNRLL